MPGMNQGDNLIEIYAWIDEVPFSKPKKNISRDFSDGVLMAELLKIYYPRFSDVHNYIPANNVAAKKENWNTLNRKIFSKIDMKLNKEMINQLANAQPGIIEKVLIDLRNKISIKESCNNSDVQTKEFEEISINNEIAKFDDNFIVNEGKEKIENMEDDPKDEKRSSNSELLDTAVLKLSNSHVSETRSSKNLVIKACGWLISWIWPFGWSRKSIKQGLSSSTSLSAGFKPLEKSCSQTEQPNSLQTSEIKIAKEVIAKEEKGDEEDLQGSGSISRLDFLRLRREVEEKNLAIGVLNRKVSCLESVMKLKDKKIGNLQTLQISTYPNTGELAAGAQNFRPLQYVMGSSISRLRSSQTKNLHKSIS